MYLCFKLRFQCVVSLPFHSWDLGPEITSIGIRRKKRFLFDQSSHRSTSLACGVSGTGYWAPLISRHFHAPSPPRRSLNSAETVRGNKRSYPSSREALVDVAATGNLDCPDLLLCIMGIRSGPVSVGVGGLSPHLLLVKALAGFYPVWEFCQGKSLWSKSWRLD